MNAGAKGCACRAWRGGAYDKDAEDGSHHAVDGRAFMTKPRNWDDEGATHGNAHGANKPQNAQLS
jgi:hypothetical protein